MHTNSTHVAHSNPLGRSIWAEILSDRETLPSAIRCLVKGQALSGPKICYLDRHPMYKSQSFNSIPEELVTGPLQRQGFGHTLESHP